MEPIYLIYRSPWGLFRVNETQATKRRNRKTTTTTVKNPNWPQANRLAIYECRWEVEPGTTNIKFNEWSERVLNLGSPDPKASVLTTARHCLPISSLCTESFSNYKNVFCKQQSYPCKRHAVVLAENDFSVFARGKTCS